MSFGRQGWKKLNRIFQGENYIVTEEIAAIQFKGKKQHGARSTGIMFQS